MKSKVQSSGIHGYNVEDLMNSSYHFLERERHYTVFQRGYVDGNFQNGTVAGAEVQEASQTHEPIQEAAQSQEYFRPQTAEEIVTTRERVTEGRYGPKRYVSTCYFQPKQIPVRYSETMIITIGSSKKKYFESVYVENKLSPFHWSESMTTIIPDSEEPSTLISSSVDIPVTKPEFHVISFESQQPVEILSQ